MGGLLLVAGSAASVGWAVQPVEPLRPKAEQQVEILHPKNAQDVDEVTLQPEQQISVPQPVSPAKRVASNVGKVVLGVTAAGVALGVAMLSLLFL